MKKQTIEERLKKLEETVAELKPAISAPNLDPNGDEWVTIGYDQVTKETFDRYGAKPFQIMKRKMKKDGKVWADISWTEAKAEAHKLGLRLPNVTEMLVLLDFYKKEKGDKVSIYDGDFLGVEELSYRETVNYELIDGPSPILRGGNWSNGSHAGVFTLNLDWSGGNTGSNVGFRCARSLKSKI